MPGTVNMICGEPGVGKTTVCLDILVSIQKNDPARSILYIPSEMNEYDLYEEAQDNPSLLEVPTLFTHPYIDHGLPQVIEKVFDQGHDVVLLDSFVDIMEKCAEEMSWTIRRAELWLLNLMLSHAEKHRTCFLCIQQYNKTGNFVGSNKLKHNTTSFMFILRDKSSLPYLLFHKNRRNGAAVHRPLYFSKDKETGQINYDDRRYEKEDNIREQAREENMRKAEEELDFEKLFAS